MSLEHAPAKQTGLSPWALKQLQKFHEVADQIPIGAPIIIRIPVTEAITGLTNQQIWLMEQDARFPKRFKLNPDAPKNGAAGHDYHEVMAWMAARRASRSACEPVADPGSEPVPSAAPRSRRRRQRRKISPACEPTA